MNRNQPQKNNKKEEEVGEESIQQKSSSRRRRCRCFVLNVYISPIKNVDEDEEEEEVETEEEAAETALEVATQGRKRRRNTISKQNHLFEKEEEGDTHTEETDNDDDDDNNEEEEDIDIEIKESDDEDDIEIEIEETEDERETIVKGGDSTHAHTHTRNPFSVSAFSSSLSLSSLTTDITKSTPTSFKNSTWVSSSSSSHSTTEEQVLTRRREESTIKRRTSVTFNEDINVRKIQAMSNVKGVVKQELWFQDVELLQMKKKTRALIEKVDASGHCNGKKYCTRGLEKYMACPHQRATKRCQGWEAVFLEQERQRQLQIYDDASIRRFYKQTANINVMEATNRAHLNAEEVASFYTTSTTAKITDTSTSDDDI
mmetsp:Transcript_35084/g.39185  ORF Transcript_35084/g.39185 Transcript_35084/m.39185 type:complete len:372 (+) Transcript_35084:66-1181(+)